MYIGTNSFKNISAKATKDKCVLTPRLVSPLLDIDSKETFSHTKQRMATRRSLKAYFIIVQENSSVVYF